MPRKSQASKAAESAVRADEDEDEDDETTEDEEAAPSATTRLAEAAEGLTKVANSIQERSFRKVMPHQFKTRSPFGARRKKMKYKLYQNGAPLLASRLTQKEVDLFEQVKPGVYFGGTVQYLAARKGSAIERHLRYNCKGADQRMKIKGIFITLEKGLTRMLTEGPMSPQQLESLAGIE